MIDNGTGPAARVYTYLGTSIYNISEHPPPLLMHDIQTATAYPLAVPYREADQRVPGLTTYRTGSRLSVRRGLYLLPMLSAILVANELSCS